MKPPIFIIGIGELAGVFARAFLRNGYPVYPINRNMNIDEEAENLPEPHLVLIAVAEKDFQAVMETLPARWHNKLFLIQNELLPHDWQRYEIAFPTVMSVWFEKKKGMDYKPLLPSPVYGPQAALVARSLAGIEIPSNVLDSEDELVFELVLKNVFVFTINIAGLMLEEGATTSMLWQKHQKLALDVAAEVIALQEHASAKTFSRDKLINGLIEGVNGDPNHKCKGRSAPGRLRRAVALAAEAGLEVPVIQDIQRRLA